MLERGCTIKKKSSGCQIFISCSKTVIQLLAQKTSENKINVSKVAILS